MKTDSYMGREVAAQSPCQHFVSKSPGRRIAVNLGDAAFVGCNAVERTTSHPVKHLINQGRCGASGRLGLPRSAASYRLALWGRAMESAVGDEPSDISSAGRCDARGRRGRGRRTASTRRVTPRSRVALERDAQAGMSKHPPEACQRRSESARECPV